MRESGVDWKSDEYLSIQLGDEVLCTLDNYREINEDSVMCEREPLDLTDDNPWVRSAPGYAYAWGVH